MQRFGFYFKNQPNRIVYAEQLLDFLNKIKSKRTISRYTGIHPKNIKWFLKNAKTHDFKRYKTRYNDLWMVADKMIREMWIMDI